MEESLDPRCPRCYGAGCLKEKQRQMDADENMEDTHTVLRILIISILEFSLIWVCEHTYVYTSYSCTHVHTYTHILMQTHICIYSKQFHYSIHFYCMCICAWKCTNMFLQTHMYTCSPYHTHGSQRTAFGIQFFSFTIPVMGIKCMLSVLAANAFCC